MPFPGREHNYYQTLVRDCVPSEKSTFGRSMIHHRLGRLCVSDILNPFGAQREDPEYVVSQTSEPSTYVPFLRSPQEPSLSEATFHRICMTLLKIDARVVKVCLDRVLTPIMM